MESKLQAIGYVRRMRGCCQAALLSASDGNDYVVKNMENPQGRRTLINEWIGYHILKAMEVSTPAITTIHVSDEFLRATPHMSFTSGNGKTRPAQTGIALASRHVGNCNRLAVYDVLPAPLLRRLNNVADFMGALVLDKWLANTDARQCVFTRSEEPGLSAWGAHMIDHGLLLDGNHWELRDSPLFGLYLDHSLYANVVSWLSFEPWIERVKALDNSFFEAVIATVPAEWIDKDRMALEHLAERLVHRRRAIPRLIEDIRKTSSSPFVNWTATSFAVPKEIQKYHFPLELQ